MHKSTTLPPQRHLTLKNVCIIRREGEKDRFGHDLAQRDRKITVKVNIIRTIVTCCCFRDLWEKWSICKNTNRHLSHNDN